jgi:hypothetical protein
VPYDSSRGASQKLNPTRGHLEVVALEVVGVKEKEDAASGLIADSRDLHRRERLGQEQSRLDGSRRRQQHPTLRVALV